MAACLRSDDRAPNLARNNTTQTSDAYCNCNCPLSYYVSSFIYTLSDNNFTRTFYFLNWVSLDLFAAFWESLS